MIKEGPFKTVAEAHSDKIIKQEITTYYVNDEGQTVMRKASRKFFIDDYVDSTSTEILVSLQF